MGMKPKSNKNLFKLKTLYFYVLFFGIKTFSIRDYLLIFSNIFNEKTQIGTNDLKFCKQLLTNFFNHNGFKTELLMMLISIEKCSNLLFNFCVGMCIKSIEKRKIILEVILDSTISNVIGIRKKAINTIGACEKIPECWNIIKTTAIERLYPGNHVTNFGNPRYKKKSSISQVSIMEEHNKMYMLYAVICCRDSRLLLHISQLYYDVECNNKNKLNDFPTNLTSNKDINYHSLYEMIEEPSIVLRSALIHIIEKQILENKLPASMIPKIIRFSRKIEDARLTFTIMPIMSKADILSSVKYIIHLEKDDLRKYLSRLCINECSRNSTFNKQLIEPSELMVEILNIKQATNQDRKKLREVIDHCVKELTDIFKPFDLIVAIEKLINTKPLPTFLMRTIIQEFINE